MSQPNQSTSIDNMAVAAHVEGRIAVLEQSVASLAQNMNNFVQNQREENNRLYDVISKMGDRHGTALDEVKNALNSRGRITGQSVLSMLAVFISFAVAIGGFGNYFINQSSASLSARITQTDRDVASVVRIHETDTQRLMTELKELRDRREADLREEIIRLRSVAP